MTLVEFQSLSDINKIHIVRFGKLLAHRNTSKFRILLYNIDCFYVEMYYSHGFDKLIIRPFKKTRMLTPYLDEIDLQLLVG